MINEKKGRKEEGKGTVGHDLVEAELKLGVREGDCGVVDARIDVFDTFTIKK